MPHYKSAFSFCGISKNECRNQRKEFSFQCPANVEQSCEAQTTDPGIIIRIEVLGMTYASSLVEGALGPQHCHRKIDESAHLGSRPPAFMVHDTDWYWSRLVLRQHSL